MHVSGLTKSRMRLVSLLKSRTDTWSGLSTTFQLTISEQGGVVSDPEYVYMEWPVGRMEYGLKA